MPLLVQQTGMALQLFPPTPMTEIGLQLTPTRALIGPSTTPSKPASNPTSGSLAYKMIGTVNTTMSPKVAYHLTAKV